MEERASTMAVLMDISSARREVDEQIESLGPLAAKPADLPDGLKPHLRGIAGVSIDHLIADPNWANTMYAAALCTLSTTPELLREHLVQLASVAVSWIEAIDERGTK
jgi:hypothetical protein